MTTVSTDVSEDVADIVLKGDERCACCRGQLVWLKSHHSSMVLSNKEDHIQLKIVRNGNMEVNFEPGNKVKRVVIQLREMIHDNLNQFVGLILEGSLPVSVWRFCSKGSLQV